MSYDSCYPDKAPKIDAILDILQDNVRREFVYFFEEVTEDDTASLDEVIEHIDGRVPHVGARELSLSLRNNHIPKLCSADWIDYDERSETIRYHGGDSVDELLTEVVDMFSDDHG